MGSVFQFLKRYSFQLFVIAGIALMCLTSLEMQAYQFLYLEDKRSLGILLTVAEVKQILNAISDMNIAFIHGATTDIVKALDKAQQFLIASSFITSLQLLVIKLSQYIWIKIIAVILLAGTFFARSKQLCSKVLILVLALNPGVVLFTIGVEKISNEIHHEEMDNGLYQRLSKMSANLKREHAELMQQHAAQMRKDDKEGGIFGWFHKIWDDVSYDYKYAKESVEGDLKEFRTILKAGGKTVFKDALLYFTNLFLIMVLLPFGYALGIYYLARHLFKQVPHSTVDFTNIELKDFLQQVTPHAPAQDISSGKTVPSTAPSAGILGKAKQFVNSEVAQVESAAAKGAGKLKTGLAEEAGEVSEKLKSEAKQLEQQAKQKLSQEVSAAEQAIKDREPAIVDELESGIGQAKTKVQSAEDKLASELPNIEDKAKFLAASVQAKLAYELPHLSEAEVEAAAKKVVEHLKSETAQLSQNIESKASDAVDAVEAKVQAKKPLIDL